MKKLIMISLILFIFFCFIYSVEYSEENSFLESEGTDKIIKEFVEVVNVEVPVRVFYKGKPIDNLKKDDFILYESGEKQRINGFYQIRKKINSQNVVLDSERIEIPKSRYFVLVFHITDFTPELQKGIKYLFNKVFHERDILLVFINDKTLFFKKLGKRNGARLIIEKFIREQSLRAKIRLYKWILKIENMFRSNELSILGADDAFHFIRRFLRLWKEYKKRYLIPDLDVYYNFANYLEKIDMEKWVINFYQIEMFPQLKSFTRVKLNNLIGEMQLRSAEYVNKARILTRNLAMMERELKVADDFPSEEISKIFYKANATFHSVFFRTYREMMPDTPMELKGVSTEIESNLREITKKTGGELIISNKIGTAINNIVEKEDILYMLTYSPENSKEKGKIKIKLRNKKYKLFYDDNIRADYLKEYLEKRRVKTPLIQIGNLKFTKRTLSMAISDFSMEMTGTESKGKILIGIVLKNKKGELVFGKNKIIEASENKVSLSLLFNWLKSGEYTILVNVKDLISEKTAIDILNVKIE